jgi:uncharacterized membrane protein YfcA
MGDYSLFFLLALLAEIIGTISGFGSSILFVPIASLFLDFKVVLGITAVFHVFSNLAKIYFFHEGIDKKIGHTGRDFRDNRGLTDKLHSTKVD